VVIAASVVVDGLTYPFVDHYQQQRPGLLLQNGTIYIGFGSPGCNIPRKWAGDGLQRTDTAAGWRVRYISGSRGVAVWLSVVAWPRWRRNIYFSTGDGLFDGPGERITATA